MPLNAFWGFEMAKKGFFYSIFVVTDEKFWILKFGVLAFFEGMNLGMVSIWRKHPSKA